jgi:hypothetical protein
MRKQKLGLIILLFGSLIMAGCGRSERKDQQAAPTPTVTPPGAEPKSIKVGISVDREISSLVNRYLEAQVVDLSNGQAVGTASKTDVGRTIGMPNEWSLTVQTMMQPGKEYGLRAGVFDSAEKKVLLLSGQCLQADQCRFYPNSTVDRYKLKLVPAADPETIYNNAVPPETRARCSIKPDQGSCGLTRTMQFYDATKDTCYRAPWGGCGQGQPFASGAECLQACGKKWP